VVTSLRQSTDPEAAGSVDPERAVERIPALDGVRALGIILVLCFHGGFSWASGGFLGVDVFFVLSGFLITGLLVSEYRQHQGIALLRFWGHRIRRLFPALLAVLAAVALYAWLLAPPDTLGQLRGDAIATLFYVNNWHLIAGSHGYFAELATPRPLLHTWSLSIEEQFYVVWPLIVLGILHVTRSLRVLLVATIGAAVASAIAMAVLFEPGLGEARAYYGTDTRAQALLIGAALAIVLARPLPADGSADPSGALVRWRPTDPSTTRRLGHLGLGCLVVIGLLAVIVDGGATWPYRGGFALLAVAAAGLIGSVALAQATPVARLLSMAPVRYVGAISYGLYLWHWPIFVVLDAPRTGLVGLPLFAVRATVSILVAAASYHLLELPIRRGTFSRGPTGWLVLPIATGLVVAAVVVATTVPVVAAPKGTGQGLSATERQALAQAGAFDGHPIRFMLFGDSLALTLAIGLGADSAAWGVETLFTHTALGCDLDPEDQIIVSGTQGPATPGCRDWQHRWPAWIEASHAEVVGIFLGRWEIVDHLHDGVWQHIGEADWDAHLTAELDQAIADAVRAGAKVVLFTMPYVEAPTAPDGSIYPEDTRARIDAYNDLLRRVAAAHPGEVTVYDLNAAVDPHGTFEWATHGVEIRTADGVHFTRIAGELLRASILPLVGRLGLEARAAQASAR
jgi:peptidoglycan/LPS O-acetylase OafA/YrhL